MSENAGKKAPTEKIKTSTDNDQIKITELIKDRIYRAREIITDTIISVQLYRKYNIFSNSEVNICITSLRELHSKTVETLKLRRAFHWNDFIGDFINTYRFRIMFCMVRICYSLKPNRSNVFSY